MTAFEIDNDGTVLRGAVLAAPQNPRAVMSLVHGFGEHSGRYQGMADTLSESGIAVVTLDLRGHGRSDGARGQLDNYALFRSDLRALLGKTRAEFPAIPHVLYGHSMGGALVMNHLLTHPEDGHDLYGVISSAPLLKPADPPPAPVQWMLKIVQKIKPNMALPNTLDVSKISTLPAEQALYANDPLNHGVLGITMAQNLLGAGQWTLDHAQDWDIPLLLAHAKGDRLTDYTASESFASRAKKCTFHGFENVAHEMHNDSSREVIYGLVRDFILHTTATPGDRI